MRLEGAENIDSLNQIAEIARATLARAADAPYKVDGAETTSLYLFLAAQKMHGIYEQCVQALDKIEREMVRDGVCVVPGNHSADSTTNL